MFLAKKASSKTILKNMFIIINILYGYFWITVPPKVIDEESSMDLIVKEGSDMILQCKAQGYPEPYIMWRREDGLDINYNGITGNNILYLHVKKKLIL